MAETDAVAVATAGLVKGVNLPRTDLHVGSMSKDEREVLVASFTGLLKDRESLMQTLETLRGMDVVQTILDVVIDDGFNSAIGQSFFSVEYVEPKTEEKAEVEKDGLKRNDKPKDPEADGQTGTERETNEKIKSLLETTNLEKIVKNIIEDLLTFGYYPLRIRSTAGVGITEIVDDADPIAVIPVYEGEKVAYYLEKRGRRVFKKDASEFIDFTLSPRKVRVKVTDRDSRSRTLPQYMRVGRSLIYPAISKLKRLQLLEMALVAESLRKLLTPSFVSVAVPANTSPDDVIDLLKKYETMLQPPIKNPDEAGVIPFADILAMVGRLKVLPTFSDGKGGLTKVSVDESDFEGLLEMEKALRNAIASACAIPPYYLTLGDPTGAIDRVHTLKIYSRYSRKLASIQDSLADSIALLVMEHLKISGTPVSRDTIRVKFKSIVNMDLLDSVEYAVASIQTLADLHKILSDLAQSSTVKLKVNSSVFLGIAKRFFTPLTDSEMLLQLVDKEETEKPAEEGERHVV